RNLTQYAVYRATRAGSLNHGDCVPMLHSAIATLTPSFTAFTGSPAGLSGTNGSKLGQVFRRVGVANRFDSGLTHGQGAGYTETIVWLVKERPTAGEIATMPLNRGEFSDWDQGDQVWPQPVRLETRIIYWYPMRI